VFGVSSIRLAQYEVALLAILPGCVFYSFLGSTISHLSDIASANKSMSASSPAGLTFLIVGGLITVFATIALTIVARREFVQMQDDLARQQASAVALEMDVIEPVIVNV